jgi:tetratricopeptide (TPR) repeat protein
LTRFAEAGGAARLTQSLRAACIVILACSLNGCALWHMLFGEPRPHTEASVVAASSGPPLPADVQSSFAHGVAALQRGDWATAEQVFTTLASSHPELPGPAVNLAIVYRRTGRAQQAETLLQQTAERFPRFAPAQHQLGLLLSEQGMFDAADAALRQAIDADPDYAVAYYNRAVVNDLYLQRPDVALQDFRQYQALQPQPDPQVAGWIAELERRTGQEVSQ